MSIDRGLTMRSGFYTNVEINKGRIWYRGYDAEGNSIKENIKYKPVLYAASRNSNTEYKGFDGTPVEPLPFDSQGEMRDYINMYSGVKDMKLFGMEKPVPDFIQRIFPKKISFNKSFIDIGSVDIETSYTAEDTGRRVFPNPNNPQNKILSLVYKSSKCDTYIGWGLVDFDVRKCELKFKKEYRRFNTEAEMLADFVDYWKDNTPDVITGWNSELFDIPYLLSRVEYVLGESAALKFSPWGKIQRREINIKGVNHTTFKIYGVASLDYMDLFKKFCKQTYGEQESYSLDHIATVVLGEKKLDYSEHGNLETLYREDPQKFISYNFKDVQLLEGFENKIGAIGLVFMLAYMGGCNYSDTLGTVSIWDGIIFRALMQKKIICPLKTENESEKFPGGFVKEVQTGLHDWVMSFDFASLYPNIIAQYNISPDTILKHAKIDLSPEMFLSGRVPELPKDVCVACNGVVFSKQKRGIIPELIVDLYDQRKVYKKKQLEAEVEFEKISAEIAKLKDEIKMLRK